MTLKEKAIKGSQALCSGWSLYFQDKCRWNGEEMPIWWQNKGWTIALL